MNLADFNEGTTLDATYASDPGSPQRVQIKTGAAGKFPSRNADGTWGEISAVPRQQTGSVLWTGVVDNKLMVYGYETTGAGAGTFVESPPRALPLSLKAGEAVSFKFQLVNKATGVAEARSMTRAFVAMESLTTALGTFNTCRVKDTQTFAQGSSATTTWLAAEGPYRGQVLKEAVDGGTTLTVSTMSYTPK